MKPSARTLPLLALALLPMSAGADWDYYTYDAFNMVVDAFQRLALITGSSTYQSLFLSFALGSFAFGGLTSGFRALMALEGAPKVSYSWLTLTLAGTAVFHTFINATTTLHIYDAKTNQYQTVGGVPVLMASVASVLNGVERTVVDIIHTQAASPKAIEYAGGNVSAHLLYDAATGLGALGDITTLQNLKHYYADCVPFALARQKLKLADLLRNEQSDGLLNALAKGSHKSLYTTYEVAPALEDPQAKPKNNGDNHNQTLDPDLVTCEVAWTRLRPQLQAQSFWSDGLAALCKKNGFRPLKSKNGDAQQRVSQRCQATLDRALATLLDGSGSDTLSTATFLRNSLIANTVAHVLQDQNPDLGIRALSNRAIINEGMGMAAVAANWFPVIRGVVTVIILGTFPFVALFFVTLLFPRMMKHFLGLLVWLTLWGICDAFLHQATLDRMVDAYALIQGQGLHALWSLPDASQRALAAITQMRTLSVVLSGILTYALGLMSGSHMMAQFADTVANRFSRYGEQAANDTLTPEQMSQRLDQLANANAQSRLLHERGFGATVDARTHDTFKANTAANLASQKLGGDPATAGSLSGAVQGGLESGTTAAALEQAGVALPGSGGTGPSSSPYTDGLSRGSALSQSRQGSRSATAHGGRPSETPATLREPLAGSQAHSTGWPPAGNRTDIGAPGLAGGVPITGPASGTPSASGDPSLHTGPQEWGTSPARASSDTPLHTGASMTETGRKANALDHELSPPASGDTPQHTGPHGGGLGSEAEPGIPADTAAGPHDPGHDLGLIADVPGRESPVRPSGSPPLGGHDLMAVAGVMHQTAKTETRQRIGTARGGERAAELQGQGVADTAETNTFRDQALHFSQGTSREAMIQRIQEEAEQQGQPVSKQQAWQTLADYYQSNTASEGEASRWQVDPLLDFKTNTQAMNMQQTQAYIDQAHALGYSPDTLKTAAGRVQAALDAGTDQAFEQITATDFMLGNTVRHLESGGHGHVMMDLGREYGSGGDKGVSEFIYDTERYRSTNQAAAMMNLMSLAQQSGIPMLDLQRSREGVGWNMTLTPERAEILHDRQLLPDKLYQALANGGTLHGDFSPTTTGLTLTAASARTGQSVSHDNSVTIADQTTSTSGTDMGGTIPSVQAGTTNPTTVQSVLADRHGIVTLAQEATRALSPLYDYRKYQHKNDEGIIQAGLSTPIGGATAMSIMGSHAQESHSPMTGMYLSSIHALHQQADTVQHPDGKALSSDEKRQWVGKEFAQMQEHILDRAAKLSEKDEGRFSMGRHIERYLEDQGFGKAHEYMLSTHTPSRDDKSYNDTRKLDLFRTRKNPLK